MPIPRVVARLNRVGLNKITRHAAAHVPGFGVVMHRGRRSGQRYETPVNVFATASGFRIALTYGADSDWVKNVLAGGGCRLRTRGHEVALTDPRLVHDPARRGIRPFERQVLGVLQVSDFLDLTTVPDPATRA